MSNSVKTNPGPTNMLQLVKSVSETKELRADRIRKGTRIAGHMLKLAPSRRGDIVNRS